MQTAPTPPNATRLSHGMSRLRITTAGWTIPRAVAESFPTDGSGLERYAGRFDAVEINSTFYRSHRASTYARWAEATPPDFRFAVKLPRTITHHAKLVETDALVAAFRAEVLALGDKLGPLLVQLPPSLAFEPLAADRFFTVLRRLWPERIVCEARHRSWFATEAEVVLREHQISRVAADPAPHPAAGAPGDWTGLAYWRLHGSPRMYYSPYGEAALSRLAARLTSSTAQETWCVFDNTASGAAAADALALQMMVASQAAELGLPD